MYSATCIKLLIKNSIYLKKIIEIICMKSVKTFSPNKRVCVINILPVQLYNYKKSILQDPKQNIE